MTDQQLTYSNVLDLLLQQIPELRPLFDKHLKDQFGEPLQHVFFGDLTRYTIEQVRAAETNIDQNSLSVAKRILDFLEHAMNCSDGLVPELVSVSFLENLRPGDKACQKLTTMFGPNLRRQFDISHRQS